MIYYGHQKDRAYQEQFTTITLATHISRVRWIARLVDAEVIVDAVKNERSQITGLSERKVPLRQPTTQNSRLLPHWTRNLLCLGGIKNKILSQRFEFPRVCDSLVLIYSLCVISSVTSTRMRRVIQPKGRLFLEPSQCIVYPEEHITQYVLESFFSDIFFFSRHYYIIT